MTTIEKKNEIINKLQKFLVQENIVSLETRFGDGRNWDESYEVKRQLTDKQLLQIIEICSVFGHNNE